MVQEMGDGPFFPTKALLKRLQKLTHPVSDDDGDLNPEVRNLKFNWPCLPGKQK